MMVITSKLYLETIHETTKKIEKNKLNQMDEIHIGMQERVLKELNELDRDDCMIDGYDYSAFSPYKHLVAHIDEVVKDKVVECNECGDFKLKEKMVFNGHYVCKSCIDNKENTDKITEKVDIVI